MQEIIYYNKLTFSHSSHFRLTQEHTMGNTDDIFQVLGDRKKKTQQNMGSKGMVLRVCESKVDTGVLAL